MKNEHVRDWLKRLRKAVEPARLRYFLVGEYGDQSERPHYHVALFGYESCRNPYRIGKTLMCAGCAPCELIHKTWKMGRVQNAELNKDTASYISGYVTKKMTNVKDPIVSAWLKGREPEFARMSLKPGIGVWALKKVLECLESDHGASYLIREGDVPDSLDHGRRSYPFGRYLRKKMREQYGFEITDAQPGWQEEVLQEVRKTIVAFEEKTGKKVDIRDEDSIRYILQEESKQKVLNIESRFKIFQRREL